MGEKLNNKERDKKDHNPEYKNPIDPKRVLQILEYRRKTLDFVESMLEPNLTLENLRVGDELICQRDYDCIVQERFILKICGYPLCSNKLEKEWKQRYHVSLREKRIYDVEIRKLYCSVRCMDNSKNYRDNNLNEQPLWMRMEEIQMGPNFEIHLSNL